MKLKRSFYLRPTLQVAKEMLGKKLVLQTSRGKMAGVINEVEAYIGQDDPACHAAKGKTKRNEVMFKKGGHAYIYFTYGMHYCLNIVTESKGFPAAVLIRSIIPKEGIDIMQKNRSMKRPGLKSPNSKPLAPHSLTDGPGKLCAAFGLTTKQNGMDLVTSKTLYLEDTKIKVPHVKKTARIGIRVGTEKLWRFYYHD